MFERFATPLPEGVLLYIAGRLLGILDGINIRQVALQDWEAGLESRTGDLCSLGRESTLRERRYMGAVAG